MPAACPRDPPLTLSEHRQDAAPPRAAARARRQLRAPLPARPRRQRHGRPVRASPCASWKSPCSPKCCATATATRAAPRRCSASIAPPCARSCATTAWAERRPGPGACWPAPYNRRFPTAALPACPPTSFPARRDRPPRPALRFRQDRPGRTRHGAGRPRRRAAVHRRHRQGAARGRPGGDGRQRRHRLPGDDGRPRQDPAPEGARRPAGPRRHRRRGDGRARHRARSTCWC